MDFLLGIISTVADFGIAGPLSYLTGFFKNLLAFLVPTTIVPLLNNVMAYQNFFSEGVNVGWDITRNFANLFFALILLIIAIATVIDLGGALSAYNLKNMLSKFIFVALFINFSKAIIGLLIDISQIIMVSLYNSFGPTMANTIGNASKISEAAATSNTDVVFLNVFTIVILAFLAFVLLWTALILAMRIVTLWFIIMLSPLAFIATLVPGLKSISDDWKNRLQEALVTGPTLMFLLYLAFTIMSKGISANPNITDGNLMTNGNLINYVLVIGLLFLANTTATKAGQAAPPFLQKAVGVAGSIATLGIGAKVGAGGTGFRQGLKDGWSATGGKVVSGVDGAISGTTRGVQVLSGGKINPNDRFEMWKANQKSKTEKGKAFGGGYLGAVAQQTLGGEAGKKERFNATQLNVANQAKANDTLHQNPELLRARNAAVAKATEELKGSSVPELIEQFKETTDEIEREAIFAKITELEGLKALLADDEFKHYAETFENESEQIDALIKDKFESGRTNPTRSDRDFRSRIAKIGKDKKQEAYISGIDQFELDRDPTNNNSIRRDDNGNTIYKRTDPTNKPKDRVKDLSISEMGNELKKNRSAFETRDFTMVNGVRKFKFNLDGTPSKKLDLSTFGSSILKGDIRLLADPKTWSSYNENDKGLIRNYIKEQINSRGISSGDDYTHYTKALEGLGN
jgi:hypothetical protein